jgi:hypothetical protein
VTDDWGEGMKLRNPQTGRDWRIDYAWTYKKICVEYQGGIALTYSGHKNIRGQNRDWMKINELQLHGWIVICVNAVMVRNKMAVEQIARAFEQRINDGQSMESRYYAAEN